MEGADHPERGVEPRDEVPDRGTASHRLAVRGAARRHEAAHRLGDEIERGPLRVGSGGPVPVHARDDEARIDRLDPIRPEPHLREHPGTEVLHQHVRGAKEIGEGGAARVAIQVEDDGSLVAVELREVPAQALADGARAAHEVAVRALDLDDVRSHVREELGAEGPGQHPGEVNDPNPGERPRRPARLGHRGPAPASFRTGSPRGAAAGRGDGPRRGRFGRAGADAQPVAVRASSRACRRARVPAFMTCPGRRWSTTSST